MEKILEQIKEFADQAHGSQVRRYSGDKYIVHPVRVMEICQEYTDDITLLAAALLHDVLEDTATTEEDIYLFLKNILDKEKAQKILDLVVNLTDIYIKENYPKLNRQRRKFREMDRLSKVPEAAQTIKYADTIDNSIDITKNDKDFAKLFLREAKDLLVIMDKGHPDLYKRAVQTVESCITELKESS